MWYQIFLWALFSSVFVHTIAGAICFATLRQHKYGKYVSNVLTTIYNRYSQFTTLCIHRFFPLLIIIMGVLLPLTSGVVSSAAVAFVYRASGYQMPPLYAMFWGIGQTVLPVCVGFTRILATL